MHATYLKLRSNDWLRGLVVAILAAVFTSAAQQFNIPGFDIGMFDWQLVFQVAMGAFVGYMSKNLSSNRQGEFLGKV